MNTTKMDQIAAEAATKILWHKQLAQFASDNEQRVIAIIKAAIEKATEERDTWWRERTSSERVLRLEKELESRAAHASEQEIWKQANMVCALSGAVAHDCDHYGITRPTWWRAVKKLQKLINNSQPSTRE